MTVRALDSNGDIVTSGTQFINEAEEVAQTAKTRLRLFLGEYFRDISDGTNWYGGVLGKNRNPNQRDAIIRNRIARTEGVSAISDYDSQFNLETRLFSVTCSIITPYGPTTISVSSGDVV